MKIKICSSFTENDILGGKDAVKLAEEIRSQNTTANAVKKAIITRCKEANVVLNALEGELDETEIANSSSYFKGLPMLYKDMTLVKGVPTKVGSNAFTHPKRAKANDPIVDQCGNMGFSFLGKTTMPEFGFTCTTEFPEAPPTLNPWNTDYNCGGSSGGSAALVASGALPIAHAADGGGSIRIPASCCGLVGLKPTRGRLLRSSKFERQIVDIAIDGVLTRTVRDTGNFFAEAEKIYKNDSLETIGDISEPDHEKKILGYCFHNSSGKKSSKEVVSAMEKTLAKLESEGYELKTLNLPVTAQLAEDFQNLWAMNAFMVKKFGKFFFDQPFKSDLLSPLTHGLSKHYSKHFYKTLGFIKRLKASDKIMSNFFETNKIDLFISPTVASLPPKNGYFNVDRNFKELFDDMTYWAGFTPCANAAGTPAISLPIQHHDDLNLPIGIMFWGKHGKDGDLLRFSLAMEELFKFKKIEDCTL